MTEEGRRDRLTAAAEFSVKALVVAAAIVATVFALGQVRIVVLPLIAALLLTSVLAPLAARLRTLRFPRAIAALLSLLIGLTVLSGAILVIADAVAGEIDEVGDAARGGIDEITEWLSDGPLELSQEETDKAVDDAVDELQSSSGAIASGVVSGALLVVEIAAGILLTIVLTFFFLRDGDRMWEWIVQRFAPDRRARAHRAGERAWEVLSSYIRGITAVALLDATLIGIGLWIIGVPLVVPLALFTFLGAYIPLVGAFASGLVAALVALFTGGVVDAIAVVALSTAVQQLDGNVVYPVVVGRAVRMHPVSTLLAVATGGVIAGIVGAFLAVPIAAVVSTLLLDPEIFGSRAAEPPEEPAAPHGAPE